MPAGPCRIPPASIAAYCCAYHNLCSGLGDDRDPNSRYPVPLTLPCRRDGKAEPGKVAIDPQVHRQHIVVGLPEHAERLLLGRLHLPITIYAIAPWRSPCSPKEHMVAQEHLFSSSLRRLVCKSPWTRAWV
jgi:hypothetical protein